ncbi:prenyltransferase/squalene oxidase repeat-containing protein [uncultured Draconibacterium sp.]|uniref:prenyltransferase/squalene oxidase repeat-containing protein n=1 Tax=uncultured Draconibacterium sp. TaxID=1573823 RepID=UPI0029C7A9FE|nr:prenyltransferase/squalene oxidase repeat-containing protein [uncultured Draconibacterium sp.]
MSKPEKIAIYKKLVRRLSLGFETLSPEIQQEIIDFISSQQHASGGFCDRAGKPDPYYSLFGCWLSVATGQKEEIEQLKAYISKQPATSSTVEELAINLMKTELFPKQKNESRFSLLKKVFSGHNFMDISYRFFLLALTIDATAKSRFVFNLMARVWLPFYKVKENSPCSLVAALCFARFDLGLEYNKYQKLLLEFHQEKAGFRAFETTPFSDTLSTGVALFSLAETNYDLRLITPDCLDFIQMNYLSGAFLSGDGDETRDLEYTFYGLLALGSLVKDELAG